MSTHSDTRRDGEALGNGFRLLAQVLEEQQKGWTEDDWHEFEGKLEKLQETWRRTRHSEPPAFVVVAPGHFRLDVQPAAAQLAAYTT
jgi:hypothetical protein